jgi:hypothetical protein
MEKSDDASSIEEIQSARKERLTWGVISTDELQRPGAILMSLIFQAASTRNLKPNEVCEALGVSYSYFVALRSGVKAIPNIGEDLLERIAGFLRLPKIVAKLAAGQLSLEDFYPVGQQLNLYLEPALRFIQADPKIGAAMPLSVFTVDRELQLFLITLYEMATGTTILPGKVSVEDVVNRFNNLISSNSKK